MLLMLEKAKEKNLKITREAFAKSGKKITFFKGIDSWFERITQYGKELNIANTQADTQSAFSMPKKHSLLVYFIFI